MLSLPPKPVALIFSDMKLDDKVAITYLARSEEYSTLYVILSGIYDMDRAHQDLVSFIASLKSPLSTNVVVVKGENVFPDERQPHEHVFQPWDEALPALLHFKDWEDWFEGPKMGVKQAVHVFHIAPTPRENISALSQIPQIDILLYHLVHGWNTYQPIGNFPTPIAAQFDWLKQLQKELRGHHPDVLVVFTNSYGSFNPPGSGTAVPYQEFKDTLPSTHLEAAIDDGFYPGIMKDFDATIRKHNILLPNGLRLVPSGFTDEDLAKLFLEARENKTERSGSLRQHFLDFISAALPPLKEATLTAEEKTTLGYVEKAATQALTENLSVGLCDVLHVAAVLKAFRSERKGPAPFVPVTFQETDDAILKFRKSVVEGCYGYTLMGVDAEPLKEELTSGDRW